MSRVFQTGCLAVAAFAFAFAAASTAGAEDAKARAQRLFQEGVAAMDKGDSAAGCAKLRESLGLFAVPNTLFLVAQCDEEDGKPATALSHYKRGLALVNAGDKRTAKVKERIAALESKVPLLRVLVPPGQGSTTVSLDGEELTAAALEAPLPVDPGKHTLVFREPGGAVRSREVVLGPGERTEVIATVTPGTTVKEPPPPSGSALRTGGFVTLGIGGAALLAAGITGGIALERRSAAIDKCPEVGGVPTCPASYKAQLDADRALVIGNTVAWGLGIAGVATGAALLLVSMRGGAKRSGITPAPLFVAGGAGLVLTGEL